MNFVYHTVGLTHCQPTPGEGEDTVWDRDPTEDITDIFKAVLASGEILSPERLGHPGSPTLLDAAAGDGRYVFLGRDRNGPANFACPDEFTYSFAFDPLHLVRLGGAVRRNDLITHYASAFNQHTDYEYDDEFSVVNQYACYYGDPVYQILEDEHDADPDGFDITTRQPRLETALVLLTHPPAELKARLREIADHLTFFGEKAERLLKNNEGREVLFPDSLPLIAMDHAIVAGKQVYREEIAETFGVFIPGQLRLW